MMDLLIRPLCPQDLPRAAAIYRSDPMFLRHHLGMDTLDTDFLRAEVSAMEKLGFLPSVIQDRTTGTLLGVLDYRPGTEVYLSLLLLDAPYQHQGLGQTVYRQFEAEMVRQGSSSVRIDVVDDHPDHPGPFWEGLGFRTTDRVSLTWGAKTSSAAVMKKDL